MLETLENWALQAFADGELSEAEKAEVERLLSQDMEARRVLDGIQRQKSALHKAYDPVLAETLPPRLISAVKQSPRLAFAGWRNVAAAGLVALFLGAGAGWFARTDSNAETLADRAVNAYKVFATDPNHAVEISAVDSAQLEHWLAKRIGVAFSIPDLGPQGYNLVGGRLLAEGDKPAGLLLYENAEKKRLAIYVAANPKANETGMVVQQNGAIVSCYWAEKDMVYALAGEQQRADMLSLAAAAHEGFDQAG